MSEYRQLNNKNEDRQKMVTDYYNAIIDALNNDEDTGIILITQSVTNPRVMANIEPKTEIPRILNQISTGYEKAIKKRRPLI